jgi:hypothetical protein
MNKKVVICFLLFAFLICQMGIKNSLALDNNGYFSSIQNVLGNMSWSNYEPPNPYAVTTPTWNMIGEITSWDMLGTSNRAGIGNNLWGNLERYIGNVSINDDTYLLGSSPSWSPRGSGLPYDTYGAVGTSNWAGIGNNLWSHLGTYFGTPNPYAVGTPTWNMFGEITSWDELGTSNWGSIGNNLWSSLGTYFGSGSPYAVGTPTWNMFGEITSWDELGTSNWGSSNEAEDLVNNLQEGVDELINEYFEWW